MTRERDCIKKDDVLVLLTHLARVGNRFLVFLSWEVLYTAGWVVFALPTIISVRTK
jgi:hypothetical protein